MVLPERVAPGEPVQPASASVFIKHDPRLEPDSLLPRIRRMVASSIPGMTTAVANPQKLTVIFVPAAAYKEKQQLAYFGPFLIKPGDLTFWHTVLTIFFIVLVAGCAAAGFWLKKTRDAQRAEPNANDA